jgi:purine-nucleoside phosphorylase
MPPGSVMRISDHINFSGSNPLFGEPSDRRFVGMTNAYDTGLGEPHAGGGAKHRNRAARGCLHVVFGPSFETPAEIRMARTLGRTRLECPRCPR